MFDKEVLDRELRKTISYIKNVLEHQDPELSQQELQNLLTQKIGCTGNCDDEDLACIKENASLLSFVSYRLTITDARMRDIALCMLEEMPSRSFHITSYLAKFANNIEILNHLYTILEQEFGYSSVRIDCARAIVQILGGLSERLQVKLIYWTQYSQDWFLRDAAIDLLSDHTNCFLLLHEIANNDDHHLVRSKAIFRAFDQCSSQVQQITLLNMAFCDRSYTVKSLGIYLFRREAQIPRETLNSDCLPENLRHQLRSTVDIEAIGTFSNLFAHVFDLEANPNLRFLDLLPNISDTNQMLLDIADANSNPIDFIKALHDFTLHFLIAFVRITRPQFTANALVDVLTIVHVDGSEYTHVSKLRDAKEHADTGNRRVVDYNCKQENFANIKRIVALDLSICYDLSLYDYPRNLSEYLQHQRIRGAYSGMDTSQVVVNFSFS